MSQQSDLRVRREAIQRVQVGLIGVGAVLLVVTLANLVIRSVHSDGLGTGAQQSALVAGTANGTSTDGSGTEPLADLGVTPKSDQGDAVTPSVPDLEPDPRLSKPMDQDPGKARSQRR